MGELWYREIQNGSKCSSSPLDLFSSILVWFCGIMFVFSMGHQYKSVFYIRGVCSGATRTTRRLCLWMRQMDFLATWKLSISSIISPILHLFLPKMNKPAEHVRTRFFCFEKVIGSEKAKTSKSYASNQANISWQAAIIWSNQIHHISNVQGLVVKLTSNCLHVFAKG